MNSSRRPAMAAMATLVPSLSFSHCLFNTVPVRSDDCITAAKKQAYALIRMKVVGQQMSKSTSNPCTSDQTKKGRNEGLWLSNSRQHCFFQRSVHGKDWALNTSTYSQQNRVHCNNLYLPPMGLHASHLHSCTIATAYIVHHYARQVSHNVDHAQPKLSGLFAPLTTALQRGSYYETALRQTTALPIHL